MTQRVLYENGQPAKMVMQSAELGDTLIYIDVAAKHMVIYDPSDNTAIESELDDESAGDFTEILVNADNLVKEVDILSVEDVNGVSCWVVETTMEGEEAKAKVWIDREFGLIRQIDDGETPITIEYSRLNEIPEAEFEVPQV
jgi:outer membrane lipoprotein-sorting protein